ncbi:sporulation histidine kinase inhibitor Sda [Paenalkalicoccus suaedae]|uniref:Sporulation histidine kinase inhibitor Sda n=1 Tax=Paenalkalicoccus suaedae TaxID=2592382 RepID=A0A859FK74_9BACI|nr:sporulation histidine kinase inhibitor Sda [Paenalkalicoccus suaedae]QKS73203.1 sporulation histidine kinase inhibitor Sda [Paenalkalicoccus suaedae]
MYPFENLSDSLLIETYQRAINYQLSRDFLSLIEDELARRGLLMPLTMQA